MRLIQPAVPDPAYAAAHPAPIPLFWCEHPPRTVEYFRVTVDGVSRTFGLETCGRACSAALTPQDPDTGVWHASRLAACLALLGWASTAGPAVVGV